MSRFIGLIESLGMNHIISSGNFDAKLVRKTIEMVEYDKKTAMVDFYLKNKKYIRKIRSRKIKNIIVLELCNYIFLLIIEESK